MADEKQVEIQVPYTPSIELAPHFADAVRAAVKPQVADIVRELAGDLVRDAVRDVLPELLAGDFKGALLEAIKDALAEGAKTAGKVGALWEDVPGEPAPAAAAPTK